MERQGLLGGGLNWEGYSLLCRQPMERQVEKFVHLKTANDDESVECKPSRSQKEEKQSGGCYYVRADKINLADIGTVLEKQLNREWSREREREKGQEKSEIDLGKLAIKYAIARGTYGAVYRGVFDGQDVAVKLLEWDEGSRMTKAQVESVRTAFNQEVAVWHKLNHPNISKFIGASVGKSDLRIPSYQGKDADSVHLGSNACCVVVEYLAGGTLKNFLFRHRRTKLDFKIVIQLALHLSRGLSYLHSCSIVHRDIKTENLLLDKKMSLKIADFGVARVESMTASDMTGETGTLGYMAPEVLDGKPYNRKCDVYSFGICLWEIYCCDMPYPNLSFSEMSSAVVRYHLRPEIPRCCPSSLASIMKKCWHVNPYKRPNMDEVVFRLEAIDTSKGGGMTPVGKSQGCWCFSKH